MRATYSPEDNSIRLYPDSRLPQELYDRVKAEGFKWAPQQKLFKAPMWTPSREDLMMELCGEIEDEDTSLIDRAEERSERFEQYSENRAEDANRAREAVSAIADNIPLGQPLLIGHHSEKHARRDAEKIENGMRRAVKMWETSQYWTDRAEAAIRHAKYKERPDVRYRRIKKIEADKRRQERYKSESEAGLAAWTKPGLTHEEALRLAGYTEHGRLSLPRKDGDRPDWDHRPSAYDGLSNCSPTLYAPRTVEEVVEVAKRAYPRQIAHYNRWIQHYENRLAYEHAMLGESGGTAAQKFDLAIGGRVKFRGEWRVIDRVNCSNDTPCSVSVLGMYRTIGVEEFTEYMPPTEEDAKAVKAIKKLPPICNYPGNGLPIERYGCEKMLDCVHITQEQWDRKHKDYKGTRVIAATKTHAAHRVRYGMFESGGVYVPVFITDAKRKDPPAANGEQEEKPTVKRIHADDDEPVRQWQPKERTEFDDMRETLKAGIQVVSAPQLFPTPYGLAKQMVELADIWCVQRVLEPSAGTGALLEAFAGKGREIVAVEINQTLADGLRQKWPGFNVRCADFLQLNGELGQFDKILMNPPFANGQDIQHILHAIDHLKPGGRLVAICANGSRQNEKLRPMAEECGEWIDLPEGSFKESGTNVNTAMIVYNKPE
jgi:protein-L-isoaspartate O-methyltransferase